MVVLHKQVNSFLNEWQLASQCIHAFQQVNSFLELRLLSHKRPASWAHSDGQRQASAQKRRALRVKRMYATSVATSRCHILIKHTMARYIDYSGACGKYSALLHDLGYAVPEHRQHAFAGGLAGSGLSD